MTNLAPLPTAKDESWRYGDLKALQRVWPRLDAAERIDVAAGQIGQRIIDTLKVSEGVGIIDLDIHIGEGARFDLRLLVHGADYGRVQVKATLAKGAHFELGGAILGQGAQTLEIVSEVMHTDVEASSRQIVRSVLAGKATGSFLGKVHVARQAQQTDALQSVKAMLLDRTATANIKPELEIFADDVKCAHGATVGELDRTALFYMASRGLPPAAAQRLMLQAFIAEAFVEMNDDDAHEAVQRHAQPILEALG